MNNILKHIAKSVPHSLKTEKTIFIQADSGERVPLKIDISEEQNLTCGWLISETIRVLSKRNLLNLQPNKPIVSLQTLDDIVTLDYWLADLERPVSILKEGVILKPFYGNLDYQVTNQKINLKYFHILKLIGAGGFSKVYLGNHLRISD